MPRNELRRRVSSRGELFCLEQMGLATELLFWRAGCRPQEDAELISPHEKTLEAAGDKV
jgi:hypothetical protein